MPDAFLTSQPTPERLSQSVASAVGNVWLMGVPTANGTALAVVIALAGFAGYTQKPRDVDVVMSPRDARRLAENLLAMLDRNGL